MGVAILNSEIERSQQMIYVLGDAVQITAGDVILIGANLLGIAVEVADGATARAVSVAASEAPNPDRTTVLLTAEDVTLPKKPDVDTIAVGTKVWWDATDGFLVTATSQSTNVLFSCGATIELSDDSEDTVAINFDGRSEELAVQVNASNVALLDAYANYAGAELEAALQEIGGPAYTNRFTVVVTPDTNTKRDKFIVIANLDGTVPATEANFGKIFTAPRACRVTAVQEVHTTPGNDGSAVTLMLEKLSGTETSGNGDDLLSATIDLKGTAETVQNGALHGTAANLVLAAGDRINLVDTGTTASLAGVQVTVELEWIDSDTASFGKFFVAPKACTVKAIREVHTIAGTDSGAVTLTVERLQGTEVSGAGDDLLDSTLDLKSTAETPVSGTLTTTTADLTLAAGDRLNLIDSGVLAGLVGVCVIVELEWDVADNS